MRFLVFQHVDVEHPGVFRDFWRDAGIQWDAVELDAGERIPDLTPYDALIVMGGPMDVWQEAAHPWLKPEKAAIRRWVTRLRRPFLGICLGHQLLAEAVGGSVGLSKTPEVGFTRVNFTKSGKSDPFLAGFGGGFRAGMDTFQWHSAEVRSLPRRARVLAFNPACAVQAFRYGPCAYGLQYHVELTPDTVPEWRALPEYAASLAQALGEDGAARLEPEVAERLPDFQAAAKRLNANFLNIVETHRAVALN